MNVCVSFEGYRFPLLPFFVPHFVHERRCAVKNLERKHMFSRFGTQEKFTIASVSSPLTWEGKSLYTPTVPERYTQQSKAEDFILTFCFFYQSLALIWAILPWWVSTSLLVWLLLLEMEPETPSCALEIRRRAESSFFFCLAEVNERNSDDKKCAMKKINSS